MTKLIMTLLIVLTTIAAHSQKFDWASSGQELNLSWNYGAIGKNNALIVGGLAEERTYTQDEQALFDAQGKKIDETLFGNYNVILCYHADGKYAWSKVFSSEGQTLCGIATSKTGEIYTLFRIEDEEAGIEERGPDWLREEEAAADDEEGVQRETEVAETSETSTESMSEDDEGPTTVIKYIYHVFDSEGNLMATRDCELGTVTDLEITEMKFHPNGNLLLCGGASPGANITAFDVPIGKGGGDFLLMMSPEGKLLWTQPISYETTSCCSRAVEAPRTAIDPDGTIYMTGNYMIGAEFGNKLVRMAPASYKAQPNSMDPEEAYIAAYSEAGKFLWVQTAQAKGRVKCLAASKGQIALGLHTYGGNKAFGAKFDTSGFRNQVICLFNKQGQVQKLISPDGELEDMRYTEDRLLTVLSINERYDYKDRLASRWYYAKDSLKKRDNIAIAGFNAKGELIKFSTAHAPVETSNDILRFLEGDDCNLYLYGQLFGGFTMELSIYDKNFKAGKLSGGAPFTARVLWK